MTREQAIQKTTDKVTNLYDGSILSKYSVRDIIDYYEAIKNDQVRVIKNTPGNIESNFQEDNFRELEDEQDFY
jgi:hypothetical protein